MLKGEGGTKVYQLEVRDLSFLWTVSDKDVVGLDISMDDLELREHSEGLGDPSYQISEKALVLFELLIERGRVAHMVDALPFEKFSLHVEELFA